MIHLKEETNIILRIPNSKYMWYFSPYLINCNNNYEIITVNK